MIKIRTAVVDDEMPARNELTSILQEIEEVEVVAEFSTGKSFLEFLKSDTVDVVFMDIEMPVMNGIETVQTMERMSDDILNVPQVVFSTGFAQFAIQAFDLAVITSSSLTRTSAYAKRSPVSGKTWKSIRKTNRSAKLSRPRIISLSQRIINLSSLSRRKRLF